jgi:hypothetical protein
MNKELGAQAFAHGSDIYYGAGKSPGKNELTAHELTHTIQQMGGQRNAPATPALTQGQEKKPEDENQPLPAPKSTPELNESKTQPTFQQEQPNQEVATPVLDKALLSQTSQTQTNLESPKTEISQDISALKADKSPETKPATESCYPSIKSISQETKPTTEAANPQSKAPATETKPATEAANPQSKAPAPETKTSHRSC